RAVEDLPARRVAAEGLVVLAERLLRPLRLRRVEERGRELAIGRLAVARDRLREALRGLQRIALQDERAVVVAVEREQRVGARDRVVRPRQLAQQQRALAAHGEAPLPVA